MSISSTSSFASSLRLRDVADLLTRAPNSPTSQTLLANPEPAAMFFVKGGGNAHNSHPDFPHLVLLVFEAVLEVVCVALPGYVVAAQGLFGADAQKFLANLNTWIFTPCLIFSKLGSQLNAGKLADLVVIPVIFIVQTLVSWLCSIIMSKLCRLNKRQTNYVTAMGVFGNSNSLPISLVISLSKTLRGLHWDRVPGDNDEEVAARGILYLLIFQQLGQLLRWSWGFNVLLAKEQPEEEPEPALPRYTDDEEADPNRPKATSDYGSGAHSPQTISTFPSSSTLAEGNDSHSPRRATEEIIPPTNGNQIVPGQGDLAGRDDFGKGLARHPSVGHMTQFPSYTLASQRPSDAAEAPPKSWSGKLRASAKATWSRFTATLHTHYMSLFHRLPASSQKVLARIGTYIGHFFQAIFRAMNPPLWAMLIGVIVASVPSLQHMVFSRGTFVNNSITHAIKQNGDVAVPLILVVLGANLARNTIPSEQLASTASEKREEKKLLIAALVSRMLLPFIIMAPLLALFAKYVPVSILDDPIFIIVCFLLTGAPSALQLAQICQVNNVFTGTMSKLLFHSYVVWILPSTLVLVTSALEVVEWATQ